jgi:large subunit ribosomal protein L3
MLLHGGRASGRHLARNGTRLAVPRVLASRFSSSLPGGLATAPECVDPSRRIWSSEVYKVPESVTAKPWDPQKKRVGVVGRKMGMMQTWNVHGEQEVLTVIRLESCQVTNVKVIEPKRGETRVQVQVGAGRVNVKRLPKARLAVFKKAGLEPKKELAEFTVSEDGVVPVGTTLTARHFRCGQMVDVQGVTRGKGFQGVMKRWGFRGGRATHGVSKAHRTLGSTGNCQDPGRVWPGKKMPGRMGGKRQTQLNCQVYKIDVEKDLVFLRGSIPGATGSYLKIRDAIRAKENSDAEKPLPYPTYVPTEGEEQPDEIILDLSHLEDPFAYG